MPDPGEFNPNNRIAPGSDSAERPDFRAESAIFNKQLQTQEEQTKLLREISDQLLSNQKSVEETLNKANQSSEFIAKIQSEQNRFQTENFARISETQNQLAQSQELVSRSVSSFTPTEQGAEDSTSEFKKFIEAFRSSEFGDIQSEGQPREQVEIFRNIESRLAEQNDAIEGDIRRRIESEDEADALPLWFREVAPEIQNISENIEEIKENTEGGILRFIFNILKTIAIAFVGLAAVGGGLYLLLKGNFLESLKESIGKALGGLFDFAKDKFKEMFPNASEYIEGALVSISEYIEGVLVSISEYIEGVLVSVTNKLEDMYSFVSQFIQDKIKDMYTSVSEYIQDKAMSILTSGLGSAKDMFIQYVKGLFSEGGLIGSALIEGGTFLSDLGREIRAIFRIISPPELVKSIIGSITGIFAESGIVDVVADFSERFFGPIAKYLQAGPFGRVISFFARILEFMSPILSFLSPVLNFLKFIGSKILFPLTIIITVIDALVGAFKGFSRDGIKGMIVGAVAGIISGITGIFGISFDAVYDYLMSWVNDFSGTLKTHLSAFWNFLLEYNPISMLFKAIDWLVTSVAEMLGVDHILKKVKEFMGMIFDGLKDLAYGILEWITGVDWSSEDPVSETLGTDAETLAEAQKTGEGETAWIAKKTAQNAVGTIFGMDDGGPISLPPDPEVTALLANMKRNQETSIEMSEDQNTSMGQMTKELQRAQEDVSKTNSSATVINNRTTNNVGTPSASRSEPIIIAPQSSRNTEPTIRTMQFGEQPAF